MNNRYKSNPLKIKLKGIFIISLITFSATIFAQSKKAVIQGTIRDVTTNEAMPFTNVLIEGTTIGTISDALGIYSIKQLAPGTYKLKASFIGYDDAVYNITINADEVITQDIYLSYKSVVGEEVVITALARGQVKAINTQLSSRTIKNVVSEAKIRELPDANVAEALSRLPGVSVDREGGEATSVKIRGVSSNTVYVNGMRMEGGLGAVGPSMMGSIELSKAFMPDQDADVLGGSIDLIMREAESGFKGDISFRQGYNNFNKSFKMQDATILLSNRFFKDKLGIMLGFSYDRKNRGRDSYYTNYRLYQAESSENSYDISDILIQEAVLTKVENLNSRYGLTIFSDYKFKLGKIYYQGFFAKLNSDNVIFSNTYRYGNITNYDAYGYTVNDVNMMNGVGGELNLGSVKIDFGVSLSNRLEETPDRVEVFAHNINSRYSFNWITPETTLQQFTDPDSVKHDINNTVLDIIHRVNEKNTVDEYSYKINFEIPYKISNVIDGYIKFGGKIRDISRSYDKNQVRGNFFSGTELGWVSPELNKRMPELEMNNYIFNYIDYNVGVFVDQPYAQDFSLVNPNIYFLPDFNKIRKSANAINDLLFMWQGENYNDYKNNEQFYATYIMSGINLGKYVTFTPGVRYEKESNSTEAKKLRMKSFATDIPSEQGIISDTIAGSEIQNFLPMFHLKVKPVKWADVRLAYTHTLTRPSFYMMSPKVYEDYASIGNPSVFRGNADLRPQANTNYDISLSLYSNKVGLFTTSLFYKEIQDQIFNYSKKVVDPTEFNLPLTPSGIVFSTPINNPYSGYVRGIEFDWQNQFGYLPKPFNGFIINANIAFMNSESKYPFYLRTTVDLLPDASGGATNVVEGVNTYRITKVIGQPDVTCNLGLGYEIGGFSTRISYYYQGFTFTDQVDLANVSRDVNIEPFSRIDIQVSQKIKRIKGLMFYLNISNLTNVHDKRIYTYHPEIVRSDEVYGAAADIGIRYRF